jgi:hypothetical protein
MRAAAELSRLAREIAAVETALAAFQAEHRAAAPQRRAQ